MPELPEVEAVCRNLRRDAKGARVVQFRVMRPNVVAPQKVAHVERSLAGQTLAGVERRGKNIFLRFSGGHVLHVHLRMTGHLHVIPDARLRSASTRAWMELEGGKGLVFDDPRNLGRMRLYTPETADSAFEGLGVEPLSDDFTAALLVKAAAQSRKPAKLFLMDQRPIAGLGNIYAAEALFHARINPCKPIGLLRRAKLEALHKAIVDVLNQGLESAVLAYSTPGGFTEAEGFACAVYGRENEPCQRCGRMIKRIAQGGRSTCFCPSCQR